MKNNGSNTTIVENPDDYKMEGNEIMDSNLTGNTIPVRHEREYMYSFEYSPDMRISISSGNSKIGKIHNINLLAGGHEIYNATQMKYLVKMKGTCQGCCNGCEESCYAIKDTKRHHNVVVKANVKNTLIMRNNLELYFSQISDYLKSHKVKIFRFHSSGEIETYEYLLGMEDIAKKFPDIHFYFYTKRFDFIKRYLEERGMFPDNLVCNISEWHDNIKGYDFSKLNKFVYDDGVDKSLESVVHCPAVKKVGKKGRTTGITCDKCGICWRANTGRRTAVYEH